MKPITITLEVWRVLIVVLVLGNLIWATTSRLALGWLRADVANIAAFADAVRTDLQTKQCVYMPFVPRDTIRRPR